MKQLTDKINHFVHDYNITTRPFVWTATAHSILAKMEWLGTLTSRAAHWEQAVVKTLWFIQGPIRVVFDPVVIIVSEGNTR